MSKKLLLVIALIPLLILTNCQRKDQEESPLTLVYPETKKGEVVDDYFGIKVPDPYRWLEDENSPEVKEWLAKQNQVTFSYLNKIPFREKIRRRIKELYNYPKYKAPSRAGEYFFFYKNNGLQNQYVIYIQKVLDGNPEVFIDPNKLSPDGTLKIHLVGFSKNNRYVALSRSQAGSDWRELRVMEINTRKELSDRIRWVKFSDAAWQGNGFYYSGYDKPEKGRELTASNKFHKVFYHKLGTPQDQDILIYHDEQHPFRYFWTQTTEDEKFLFLYISQGTHGNELLYRDLSKPDSKFLPLITGFEYDNYVIDNVHNKFLVHTNLGAPNWRVILIDPQRPEKENWQTIIAETKNVLKSVYLTGGQLFCHYLKDANSQVFQYNIRGKQVRKITLPTLGTCYHFFGKKQHKILFFTFTSFTYPATIYKYHIDSGKTEVFHKSQVKFNPENYQVKQVFYYSRDGTRVPMFIVHKNDIKKDGSHPAYLYAYGGFNNSKTPYFSALNIFLLENGVVYALANIRGGGEYGEAWHKAGMLLNKQNVFDDFIAAAEYLIKSKYSSQAKLAITGASNGGLLVGACLSQRPDLFKVALPDVGVMDMLRYHKFTVGWGWAVEYGSSDREEDFKNLFAYSPLHNIKKGISYPATLITTADHDDRVVPAHSYKFAAVLQAKHRGKNPVLIRIDTSSGHSSSSTMKRLEEYTDRFSFMFYNLGISVK